MIEAIAARVQSVYDQVGERNLSYLGVLALLAVLPNLMGPFIASHIIVMAIFAMGYNIILGFGGELSFGHAAYFGLGAYGVILSLEHLVSNLYLAIPITVVAVTLLSVVFGYLSLRRRGIYFAMITLALAQLVYAIVFQMNELTGGSNGIAIPATEAPLGPLMPMNNDLHFYALACALFLLSFVVIARIVNSPFGRVLKAIRESEDRALHLGYDVNSYLWLAFAMSGAFSALAGALYAVLFVFISPSILFWQLSGEVVLMAIIGGVGTLTGPLVGAIVFIFFSNTLTSITEHWEIFFGAVIIGIVLLAPEGLIGLLRKAVLDDEKVLNLRRLLERLRP
ncbi:branched-chain amino acid ABC transporter permease [Natrinema sp. DC36]|uniref:branched-chain amino acid ABC transporter permease n=1 Tax=Natrinema sp. DC36 TaxID=2878680 RepID=UPI001CEFE0DD|nr:branched-chain amino acid ABC transporter permease [Natrinema sp. DC36]